MKILGYSVIILYNLPANLMMSNSRKELLSTTTSLSLFSSAQLFALYPTSRINPKLKGLSLATYSKKPNEMV